MENSLKFSCKRCNFGLVSRSDTNLPTHIFVEILLQVPAEDVIICKCVCKAWYKIISDPEFVKIYFSRADVYPLIRTLDRTHVSRTLYLVDPTYYIFDSSAKMSLRTKFKIPLHNAQMLFESENQAKSTENDGSIKRKRCLELNPNTHKFNMTNSCKGFLCLSNQENAVICNAITGEYVNIPTDEVADVFGYWLGFSSSTNNFKVIRIFGNWTGKWWTTPPTSRPPYNLSCNAQIQILGSSLWKDLGPAPQPRFLEIPTFLNGTLNWVFINAHRPKFIVSFDFDNHRFRSFSLPPRVSKVKLHQRMRIGVLRDMLCYCYWTIDEILHIWVMSEYGVEETWTNIRNVRLNGDYAISRTGFYQPINQLENGAIILFQKKHSKRSGLIYYEPQTNILKYFRLGGVSASFEAIGFAPSFTLLKDVLVDDELEIFNVKSRCAKLKIPKDNITPFLVHDRTTMIDPQTSVNELIPNQS